MKVSVYLHRNIYDTLISFGKLSNVVNNILDASDKGLIDIMDKPDCGSRDGASRYEIDVQNQSYIYLQNEFGVTSKRCSLRRLLYWFVNEEIYLTLGWKANDVVDYYRDKAIKSLNNAIDECYKCKRYIRCYNEELDLILQTITEIRNKIK